VGLKKIDELKKSDQYDEENPGHEHQRVVTQLDVYAVHREKKTRDWLKEQYPWILLLFVPARTTKKLQELDVGVNNHVQSGSKTYVNKLQVERIIALLDENPDATPIITLQLSELKRDVFPTLQAGLEQARKVGEEVTAALWETTGKLKAWDPLVQIDALKKHARGELFVGERKEDTPYGLEVFPEDYEADDLDPLPVDAPPKPTYASKSPQMMYVANVRGEIRRARGLTKMADAEAVAKVQWKALPAADKRTWELEKKTTLENHRAAMREWKGECQGPTFVSLL
jgi:hypothetical protein